MIPLRDTIRPRTYPIVNITIIVLNIIFFLMESSLNEIGLVEIFYLFGLTPSSFLRNLEMGNFSAAITPLFTSIFLHGGWLHIISNMLFLWVFGDNVEDRVGHFKYLVFYLTVGAIANITQVLADPLSTIPIIGASGAVAGILGAYYVSFPRAKILALIPIIFFFTLMEVRASFFIIFWFILQVFNGVFSISTVGNSVAWWAHIGGFLGGILLIRFFKTNRKLIL
ncbi:MAG: rhomboid family intramembrane serine protease [Peptococcales bacterium]|jgi:membrane associated rhomboid family serine protease